MQENSRKCNNGEQNAKIINATWKDLTIHCLILTSYCNIRYDNTNHKVIRKIRLKTMNMKMTE